MSRVLLVQLRRFGAPGALLILLAGTVSLFLARGEWSGGWMSLAMSQRDYLMLLSPLALAIGAWLARREHRAKTAELFAGTPRPHHQRILLTLTAVGLAVTAAYLAVLAVSVPWIVTTASYLPGAVFGVVAVGVLVMLASAWIGLAMGRLLPSPATAPALAVAGFVVILAAPMGFKQDWLAVLASPTWGMNPFSEFQTVPLLVSAAQAILALSLIVAAAVAITASRWQTRAAAVLPVVLGLAVSLAVVPRDYNRIMIDPVAQELVCTDDAPRVCVGRVHSRLLPEITPKAREALALLAKLPNAPTTVQEDTTNYLDENAVKAFDSEAVGFQVDVDRNGHLADADHLVNRLLWAGGANFTGCPQGNVSAVARASGAWLAGRPPVDDPFDAGVFDETGKPYTVTPEATVLWENLRKLPEAEALAKVAAVRKAGVECTDMSGLLE
ncbi:hypothetical protein [Actinoplanes derwentensis]|uniref:ABC-type transport system involved in multi-copper enzyme maturation, permease component n=1 Tax=Actinoplanes derwentensis TaxID=113562 RepID=A0A1H1ZJM5_9ACTN|nr:hypothetical protein [Actinoplanes derwentensis]GID82479.1 hypothetical protein Ade03nite_14030 [Actinoplanes derwentensis]SDT33995.1 hypothetical protein SAMN04489716_3360 [Actinoplanes derwentensis]